jgi:hypothetical protein
MLLGDMKSVGLTSCLYLDAENEELRVQVNTLRYELDNLKQERDLMELRHEKDLRDLQLKADSDFRKAQVRVFPASRYYIVVFF